MAKDNQEWKRLLYRTNLANGWYIPNRLWIMCLCKVRSSTYVLVLQETPFVWLCYLTVHYSTTHYSTCCCFNICKQILLYGFQHAIPTILTFKPRAKPLFDSQQVLRSDWLCMLYVIEFFIIYSHSRLYSNSGNRLWQHLVEKRYVDMWLCIYVLSAGMPSLLTPQLMLFLIWNTVGPTLPLFSFTPSGSHWPIISKCFW